MNGWPANERVSEWMGKSVSQLSEFMHERASE